MNEVNTVHIMNLGKGETPHMDTSIGQPDLCSAQVGDPADILNHAVLIAVRAHEGRSDRYGVPYILHPLRIMMRVRSLPERVVAVLHDTVEDSEITLDDLRREGFPSGVVEGIDCLTRREGETYEQYMERVATNPLAVTVKIADLEDNMDLRRIPYIGPKEVERIQRYHQYWRKLNNLAGKTPG